MRAGEVSGAVSVAGGALAGLDSVPAGDSPIAVAAVLPDDDSSLLHAPDAKATETAKPRPARRRAPRRPPMPDAWRRAGWGEPARIERCYGRRPGPLGVGSGGSAGQRFERRTGFSSAMRFFDAANEQIGHAVRS